MLFRSRERSAVAMTMQDKLVKLQELQQKPDQTVVDYNIEFLTFVEEFGDGIPKQQLTSRYFSSISEQISGRLSLNSADLPTIMKEAMKIEKALKDLGVSTVSSPAVI